MLGVSKSGAPESHGEHSECPQSCGSGQRKASSDEGRPLLRPGLETKASPQLSSDLWPWRQKRVKSFWPERDETPQMLGSHWQSQAHPPMILDRVAGSGEGRGQRDHSCPTHQHRASPLGHRRPGPHGCGDDSLCPRLSVMGLCFKATDPAPGASGRPKIRGCPLGAEKHSMDCA